MVIKENSQGESRERPVAGYWEERLQRGNLEPCFALVAGRLCGGVKRWL